MKKWKKCGEKKKKNAFKKNYSHVLTKTNIKLCAKAYLHIIGENGSRVDINSLMCCVGISYGYSCLDISRIFSCYQLSPLWEQYLWFNIEVWKLHARYCAHECRKDVFAAHAFAGICWKYGRLAVNVFKGNYLKLGYVIVLYLYISLLWKDLLSALDTCTHKLSFHGQLYVCASTVAVQMMEMKQEKKLWLLSDQSLSIFTYSDIYHVQRWSFPPTV